MESRLSLDFLGDLLLVLGFLALSVLPDMFNVSGIVRFLVDFLLWD
jgi:hypothetical protein